LRAISPYRLIPRMAKMKSTMNHKQAMLAMAGSE
jgi:hypothetical protein